MNTVIITRHFSTFNNVADSFVVGNYEGEGNAAATVYRLPEGYCVSNDRIYDKSDIECAIIAEGSRVVLMSQAGSCPDVTIMEA